ncbi:GyrI-like domain-containing protein [Actinoplanes sp. NPDC023714]|uniref:GyrI-like domain-containing protein n=1 Tax=Actinoplanes sp. NPDC023714 TaxID=3154322 RepID=UPI0033F4312A
MTSLRRLLSPEPAGIEVELRTEPARTVAAISGHVRSAGVPGWFDAAVAELDAAFGPAERTGPHGGRYANELFTDGAGAMTVFRPVREPRASGRIEVVELPAADVAVTVHTGPHDDIQVTYGRLGAWVVTHALGVAGPVHETYLPGAGEQRTEIGWPVFKVVREVVGGVT